MQTALGFLGWMKPPEISKKSLNIYNLWLQKGKEKLSSYLRAGEWNRHLLSSSGQGFSSPKPSREALQCPHEHR